MSYKRLLLPLTICLSFWTIAAHGQFTDDFSDGDFINDPVWSNSNESGAGNDFQITAEELQSKGPSATATLWISTANVGDFTSQNTSWAFKARYDNSPSGSNNIRVYIVSDQSDLTASPQGYYIEMGETGSDDGIDFYKTGSGTPLISDPNPSVSGGIDVNIKLTRTTTGDWTLEADPSGGTSFTTIGTINDTEFTTGTHFGFLVEHTSTRNEDFFFDEISVGPTGVDNIAPEIDEIQVISDTEIDIVFSEDLDEITSETPANYTVNNGIGNPSTAVLDGTNASLVHLTFSNAFANGSTNELTVQNIEDENSNAITSESMEFFYFVEESAVFKDVLITEIFADPSPANDLPEVEFIELYNNSDKVFDLENWTFADASSANTLPSYFLEPGDYLIVCDESNTGEYASYGDVIGVSGFRSLNNSGDQLTVKDDSGELIDSVAYTNDWYNDAEKSDGGWTLELIDPTNLCGEEENWTASTAAIGGTPGIQNSVYDENFDTTPPTITSVAVSSATLISITFNQRLDAATVMASNFSIDQGITIGAVEFGDEQSIVEVQLSNSLQQNSSYNLEVNGVSDCSGNVASSVMVEFTYFQGQEAAFKDVIINEVFAVPTESSDLPEVEFIELYNNSDKVFDLENWTFADASSANTLPSYFLEPGNYLIVCDESNTGEYASYGDVIGVSGFRSLNNSGDQLTVKDDSGELIDSVAYTNDWYNDAEKSDGGWTLELIDPTNLCGEEENWTASTAAIGGTPGIQNSVYDENFDTTPPTITSVAVSSATLISINFNQRLDEASVIVSNFSIDQGITISTAESGENFSVVELQLSNNLEPNVTYNLEVNGVSDCSGNVASGLMDELLYVEGATPVFKDLLITEIFADPEPANDLPKVEFVELYNRSEKIFDLANWSLGDASSSASLSQQAIFPGDYLILCPFEEAANYESFGTVLGVDNWASLNNSGDAVVIKDDSGFTVDSIFYDSDWYNSSTKSEGGWTLELIDTQNECGSQSNWAASENPAGGTPGQPNSIQSSNPDLTGARLIEALALSGDSLVLRFNEILDAHSLANTTFDFTPDAIVTSKKISQTLREISLGFSDPLIAQELYTVSVNNLLDCSGNLIDDEFNTIDFRLAEEPANLDLIINEILFNPRSGGEDFVELYNRSEKYINLDSLLLANAEIVSDTLQLNTIRIIIEENKIIAPQEYLALTEDNIILKEQYPMGQESNFLEISSLPSYPDDDGVVVLLNRNQMIDYFVYNEDMHASILDDEEGISLERVSAEEETNKTDNWKSAIAAVGFATPGYENSQSRTPTTAEGEISVNPKVIVPDGFGQNDFTTISYSFSSTGNSANVKIMDIQGRLIKQITQNNFLGTEGFFTWDGFTDEGSKASVGYYIIFFEVFNSSGEVQTFKEKVVVGSKF